MALVVAGVFFVGGVTLIVFRRPLSSGQRKAQKGLGLVDPSIITPTLVAFLGFTAAVIGALLAIAVITGRVHFGH